MTSQQFRTCEKHGGHRVSMPRLRMHSSKSAPNAVSAMSNMAPPLSMNQFNAHQMAVSAKPPVHGGINGCAYMGVPFGLDGVVCQNNMPRYANNDASFTGYWTSNINNGFPAANIKTPGGMAQIMMVGGPGNASNNSCLEACSCANDVNCACRSNTDKCGWSAVNQDCLAAVPNGRYPSLSACEKANSYGWVGK